ncbi:lysozyme inhibitor LprI family protein [Hyphomicrobium sp.]|uniref:lysozyme inhibitor LprI family protein n=1 Tax=Hyphomicrobium sp. TaxID=82 RepID=UPI002D7864D9|nr:lysozyme inhibitor LprI family protein [Hyphomicrobium sp.]HET6390023.1 lysozyme inhibitor LprI family protein [Hyphomicrobium sp.]
MSDTGSMKLAAGVAAGSLLALALFASAVRPAAAQEFDCRRAQTTSERMICRSDRLAGLDERMSSLYSELKSSYGNRSQRNELKNYQRRFLDARDSCGRDTECIRGAYLDQISVLESRLERSYRASER